MVVLSLLQDLIRFAAPLLANGNMPLRDGRVIRAGLIALPVKFGAGLACPPCPHERPSS